MNINSTQIDTTSHQWWGSGEPDCPKEMIDSNGELHTIRCKFCGTSDSRNPCIAQELELSAIDEVENYEH